MSTRVILAIFFLFAAVNSSQAHFLFLRVLPPAEGGRGAEVYFSELAEAGDPRFIDKIAHTQLWLQQSPGKFEALPARALPDRLRAHLPDSGSLMVVGSCTYGVLARPKQTPFLLRHYPKAVAGSPGEINRLLPQGKLPLEISASFENDEVRLIALIDGKPAPRAEFTTVDVKLANTQLKADDKGQAVWKPAAPGAYSVYVRNTRKEASDHDGKKYEEIREFATLSFSWPLERKDADAAAVALFEEALTARAEWRDFPGFEAKIAGNVAGRRFDGTVSIDAEGKVAYFDNDPSRQEAVSGWVEEQLGSIVLHRLSRPKAPDRKQPVLRFSETARDHPFGPLLIFDGGKFASSYRVKDRQILVVNRHIGKENMTITVLENEQNKDGKFLPRHYQVQYWDAATGRLLRTETVQNRWRRVGAWDLPAFIQSSTADESGITVRSCSLSEPVLLNKK